MVEQIDTRKHLHNNNQVPVYRPKVRGGFYRVRSNQDLEIEECTVARVEISKILSTFGLHSREDLYDLRGGNSNNPNQTPKWDYQYRDVWVKIDPEQPHFFGRNERHPDIYLLYRKVTDIYDHLEPGTQPGKLVLTGHMQHKHLAFVFVPIATPNLLNIPNDPTEEDPNKCLIDRFHDDEQITAWQRLAFPEYRKGNTKSIKDGMLQDGDPVFFLTEPNNGNDVVFFGRAHMFRLPYLSRPLDLVPLELRHPKDIDYAEALFGFVRTKAELEKLYPQQIPKQGDKSRAYAGRVFISDACLKPGQQNFWLSNTPITPKILAIPKPTSFQHYLTQEQPQQQKELHHYDGNQVNNSWQWNTVIRGHKLYWHRQGQQQTKDVTIADIKENDPSWLRDGEVKSSSTQHTHFKPVVKDKVFVFHVYFENLSDRELGALCWVLCPQGADDADYCHKLGMGKALGMGAVKLNPTLHLTQRGDRYDGLFAGDTWATGVQTVDEPTLQAFVRKFEQHILGALNLPGSQRLSELHRIGMLLRMLDWNNRPAWHATAAMNVIVSKDRKVKDRKVLPDPSHFGGSLTGTKKPQGGIAPISPFAPLETVVAKAPGPESGAKLVKDETTTTDLQLPSLINTFQGPNHASLLPGIVARIEALEDPVQQHRWANYLLAHIQAKSSKKWWKKAQQENQEWYRRLRVLLS
jgi:CRISPR-associated protein (TIGR03986 family)